MEDSMSPKEIDTIKAYIERSKKNVRKCQVYFRYRWSTNSTK